MRITKVKVLQSNAGYYLGRETHDGMPYDRLTRYWQSKQEAEEALEVWGESLQEGVNENDFNKLLTVPSFKGSYP
jgi:hypothetical protein